MLLTGTFALQQGAKPTTFIHGMRHRICRRQHFYEPAQCTGTSREACLQLQFLQTSTCRSGRFHLFVQCDLRQRVLLKRTKHSKLQTMMQTAASAVSPD